MRLGMPAVAMWAVTVHKGCQMYGLENHKRAAT